MDADGLLHVEGDVPQELSEEEEDHKVYSSLDVTDCDEEFEMEETPKQKQWLSLLDT